MTARMLRYAAFALALAGVTWALASLAKGREQEWTTGSEPALAAFEDGLEARMRLYEADAATAFRRALELDPAFAAAKVQLLNTTRDPEERKRLSEELRATDLERLNARERFLVEVALASGDPERRRALVANALTARPDDPWVLFVAAGGAWEREEWEEAERLYRALLEVDPNWVTAHNHLGYLAMSQAKFDRAAEHFRTYVYVAPDQANPHDSLGELLALTGHYGEARAEIELALAEKPDFCASYFNLLGLAVFEGEMDGARPLVERLAPHCPEAVRREIACEIDWLDALFERDYDRPWRDGFVACSGKHGERGLIFHRLALLSGRLAEAESEESALRTLVAGPTEGRYSERMTSRAELELRHMEGVRALLQGDAALAAAKFAASDALAVYWGAAEGRFKLFNLAHLALALERANDPAGAARALATMREVNPAFAALQPEMVKDLAKR